MHHTPAPWHFDISVIYPQWFHKSQKQYIIPKTIWSQNKQWGNVKPLIQGTPNLKTYKFFISSCSSLCPIHWSQVLSRQWRCSWSSIDKPSSNYISETTSLLPKVQLTLEVWWYIFVYGIVFLHILISKLSFLKQMLWWLKEICPRALLSRYLCVGVFVCVCVYVRVGVRVNAVMYFTCHQIPLLC